LTGLKLKKLERFLYPELKLGAIENNKIEAIRMNSPNFLNRGMNISFCLLALLCHALDTNREIGAIGENENIVVIRMNSPDFSRQ
jgi:hypothetical protein